MLLRAGAQVSDAFRGKTRGTKVKAWRGLARSWFDQYDREGPGRGTYLHDVAHAGGLWPTRTSAIESAWQPTSSRVSDASLLRSST